MARFAVIALVSFFGCRPMRATAQSNSSGVEVSSGFAVAAEFSSRPDAANATAFIRGSVRARGRTTPVTEDAGSLVQAPSVRGPAWGFNLAASALTCRAISPVASDAWCNANCNNNPPYCPSDFCVCGGSPSPTPSPTPTPRPTPTPSPSPPSCVSQSVLTCINDYSSFWPKCSPTQAKNIAGPAGYEFGYYCSDEWVEALNTPLSDPTVGRCQDREAIRRFLAQVAYETGYYSTVYQPADGGAGLIHMIPANWGPNARDMDALWPGNGYQQKAASMGKSFFQSASFGWRSVAAWFKRTNGVIGGCGLDLFGQAYETQTRCILGRVVDRSEPYNVVGRCMGLR